MWTDQENSSDQDWFQKSVNLRAFSIAAKQKNDSLNIELHGLFNVESRDMLNQLCDVLNELRDMLRELRDM